MQRKAEPGPRYYCTVISRLREEAPTPSHPAPSGGGRYLDQADEALGRHGDLIFWNGHVAICAMPTPSFTPMRITWRLRSRTPATRSRPQLSEKWEGFKGVCSLTVHHF